MNDELMLEGSRESDERRILLGARRALSPTDADAQRVLAATLGTLRAAAAAEPASNGAPAAEPLARAAEGTAAQGSAAQSAVPLSASWSVLPKLLAALALAGATGVLGYGLGFRAGQAASEPRAERTAQTAVPRDRIAMASAAAESVSDPESESEAESVSDPESEAEADPESESDPGSGSGSEPASPSGSGFRSGSRSGAGSDSDSESDSVSASDSAARLGTSPPAPLAPLRAAAEPDLDPVEPDPNALALELRALRRVERALRDGQPRRALALLGELDRDVPEGRLVEERLATFLMARCALGLGTPERLRRELTDSYPRSVYRARVEQSCRDGGRQEE